MKKRGNAARDSSVFAAGVPGNLLACSGQPQQLCETATGYGPFRDVQLLQVASCRPAGNVSVSHDGPVL